MVSFPGLVKGLPGPDYLARRVVETLADKGMTLLMVARELRFARKVADRVVFMHAGRIHEMGPPAALFAHPQTAE